MIYVSFELSADQKKEIQELTDDELIELINFVRTISSIRRQNQGKLDNIYKRYARFMCLVQSNLGYEEVPYEDLGQSYHHVLPIHDKLIKEADERNLYIGREITQNIQTKEEWWKLVDLQWRILKQLMLTFLLRTDVILAQEAKNNIKWLDLYKYFDRVRKEAPKIPATYRMDGWQDLCDLCDNIWVFEGR